MTPTISIKKRKYFRQLKSGVKVLSKAEKLSLVATLNLWSIRK